MPRRQGGQRRGVFAFSGSAGFQPAGMGGKRAGSPRSHVYSARSDNRNKNVQSAARGQDGRATLGCGDGKPSPYEIARVYLSFFLDGFKTIKLSVTEKTFGTWLARMRMIVSSNWLSTTPSNVTWPLSTMIWIDGKA